MSVGCLRNHPLDVEGGRDIRDLKVRIGKTKTIDVRPHGRCKPTPYLGWNPEYEEKGGHSEEVRYVSQGGIHTKKSAIGDALQRAKKMALDSGLVSFVKQKVFGIKAETPTMAVSVEEALMTDEKAFAENGVVSDASPPTPDPDFQATFTADGADECTVSDASPPDAEVAPDAFTPSADVAAVSVQGPPEQLSDEPIKKDNYVPGEELKNVLNYYKVTKLCPNKPRHVGVQYWIMDTGSPFDIVEEDDCTESEIQNATQLKNPYTIATAGGLGEVTHTVPYQVGPLKEYIHPLLFTFLPSSAINW